MLQATEARPQYYFNIPATDARGIAVDQPKGCTFLAHSN
jgi:hypothetical protein